MAKKLVALMAGIMCCALSNAPGFAQSHSYGGGLSLTVPLGDRGGGPSVKPFAYGNGGNSATGLDDGVSSDSSIGALGSGLNLGPGTAGLGNTVNSVSGPLGNALRKP